MHGVRFPHGNTFLQVNGQTSTNPAKLTLSPKLSAVDASAYSYLSFRLGHTASGDNAAPLKLWAELDRDVARLRIRGEGADYAMVCNALSPAYPEYSEGTIYKGGDTVNSAGGVYECKSYPNSGWCGQAKSYYAPGTGSAWQDAWIRK
ncbi:hypothetical protein [Glaciimonas sp. PCH181]|uniref:hypothetical protein n=1 Tax=Glaciimonas sp. PCH181 TaxID=2133943 RepID=UPI000D369092|nr:hypothetical protein [Glaciimonas sp. PCH181]PUA20072.1 hypothetical protein C7W93_09815 [Glaciimonas sp. PCH181]